MQTQERSRIVNVTEKPITNFFIILQDAETFLKETTQQDEVFSYQNFHPDEVGQQNSLVLLTIAMETIFPLLLQSVLLGARLTLISIEREKTLAWL